MEKMPRDWEDVDNKKNSIDINGLARFAVDEHNRKENTKLQFVKMDKATMEPVDAEVFRFHITLEATDDSVQKAYEVVVLKKQGEDRPELEDFKLISDAPAKASA